MILYFREACNRLNLTILEAFEVAYQWRFGKQGHVVPDYCEYVSHGVLPKYVQLWVSHLQGGLNGNDTMHTL